MKAGQILKNKFAYYFYAFVAFLGLLGAVFQYDDRVAKCDDVTLMRETFKVEFVKVHKQIDLVGKRLDQKIIGDNIDRLQSRIWKYEDRYGGPGCPTAPPHEKEEYNFLKQELEKEKRKLKGN